MQMGGLLTVLPFPESSVASKTLACKVAIQIGDVLQYFSEK